MSQEKKEVVPYLFFRSMAELVDALDSKSSSERSESSILSRTTHLLSERILARVSLRLKCRVATVAHLSCLGDFVNLVSLCMIV